MRRLAISAFLALLTALAPASPPGYPTIAPIVNPESAREVADELIRQIEAADDILEWKDRTLKAYVGEFTGPTPYDRMLNAAIDAHDTLIVHRHASAALEEVYGPIRDARESIVAMDETARLTLPLLDERDRYAAILQSIHDGTAPRRFSYVDGVESYPHHVTFAERDGSGRRSWTESDFPAAIARLESIIADIDAEIRLLVMRHGFPNDQPISRRRLDTHFAPLYGYARRTIASNDKALTARLTTAAVDAEQRASTAYRRLFDLIVATDNLGWALSDPTISKPPSNSSARFVISGTANNTADIARSLKLDFALYNASHVRIDLISATAPDVRPGETAQYSVKVYTEGVAFVDLAFVESH